MNKTTEALKMAIEAFRNIGIKNELLQPALDACKEALESQEQKPMTTTDVITCSMSGKCCMTGETIYTHPAQPLTQEIYEQLKNQSTQWTSSLPMLMHLINKHFGIDDGLDWGQQAHGIGGRR